VGRALRSAGLRRDSRVRGDTMRRCRLSTLLLLIAAVALSLALYVRERQVALAEAELEARLGKSWPLVVRRQKLSDDVRKRLDKLRSEIHEDQIAQLKQRRHYHSAQEVRIEQLRKLERMMRLDARSGR
jgi:hypothetical protein